MKKHKREDKKNYSPFFADRLLNISKEFEPFKVALRVTGIYAVFGILWIYLSDRLLDVLVQDKKIITLISTFKGWIFVILTGMLIFGLVYFSLNRIKNDKIKLEDGYQELASTYEELEATYAELTASEEELRQQYDTIVDNQAKIMENEEKYRLISEASNDGIWDELDNVRHFSERWLEITGYSRQEVEKMADWMNLIHPEDFPAAKALYDDHLAGKTSFYSSEYRIKRKDGNYIWIQSRGKAAFDGLGKVGRIAGSHTDISKLKDYQNELQYLAFHDALTGRPNRLALFNDVNNLLVSESESKFSFLFLDVDDFKFINDTHGHDFGDQIIILISERITEQLDNNSTFYRLGGDEFIIINKGIGSRKEAELFAEQIMLAFKEPVIIASSNLRINISIGICLYPEHGRNSNELLRCADIAMYKAKDIGGNYYITFAQSMNDVIIERMQIEEQLHNAMENKEFVLFYQPQYDIMENKITGMEALIRWNNPVLGHVPPLKFIEIAEETHYIIPLGKWVLEEACAFMKRIQPINNSGLTISINISILQLLQNDFVDMVLAIIEQNNLDPSLVELEITESILMESYDIIKEKLNKLCEKGIKIALDDFGKGYSSLSYLKVLPISTLKIDKSFVDSIYDDSGSNSLTEHIVIMGRSLGLKLVAEGVETKEQLDYLINHKCHKIQGYLYSKPLPEQTIIEFLEKETVLDL